MSLSKRLAIYEKPCESWTEGLGKVAILLWISNAIFLYLENSMFGIDSLVETSFMVQNFVNSCELCMCA